MSHSVQVTLHGDTVSLNPEVIARMRDHVHLKHRLV